MKKSHIDFGLFSSVAITTAIAPLAVSLPHPAFAQNPATTITVDANTNKHAIDPRIYGTAYGTSSTLAELNAPLNRLGATTPPATTGSRMPTTGAAITISKVSGIRVPPLESAGICSFPLHAAQMSVPNRC